MRSRARPRRKRRSRGIEGLPPLESIPAFESAARHESFVEAAHELDVTPATVSNRVADLEEHLGTKLFKRQAQGVALNAAGREFAQHVRKTLKELAAATCEQRAGARERRLRLVAVEVVAEKWLMPRLADFQAQHPEIAIEFETDHREVDPERRAFDLWIAFTDEVQPGLEAEPLFDETLVPVCSKGFLEKHGRPQRPGDLHQLPLLYDLHWKEYWAHWFAQHRLRAPDLTTAFGFRLYSMMIQAAVDGMGIALGHSLMIARELEQGTLVSLFESRVTAPARYLLVTAPASIEKPQVRAFRKWVLQQPKGRSAQEGIGATSGVPPAGKRKPSGETREQNDTKTAE